MFVFRRASVAARALPSFTRPSAISRVPSRFVSLQSECKWTATSSINTRSFHASVSRDAAAAALKNDKAAFKQPETLTPEDQPVSTFRDLADMGLVSNRVIDVITEEMKFNDMTDVQRLTINACLKGRDVYVLNVST